MNITLTDAERLILSNQYEILSKLHTPADVALAQHFHDLSENLRFGHAMLYRSIFDPIEPVFSDEENTFVFDVLSMFSALKASYNALEDKSNIEPSIGRWPGFDGNHESTLLRYTRALADADYFPDVLGKTPPNSHIPMKAVYRRMLNAYVVLGAPGLLSRLELEQVYAARRHPDA